jgi:adenine-specific DNA-methyltransferase
MKYMGSKKFMLKNGLGELIRDQLPHANRFVDPFCGSGSVVHFVAQIFDKQIVACDLQEYAVVLANAVIGRTQKTDTESLKKNWLGLAEKNLKKSKLFLKAINLDKLYSKNIGKWVKESRKLCETKSIIGPVWNAYGGHYFSPKQSLTFDYLIKTLPQDKELGDLCLASDRKSVV